MYEQLQQVKQQMGQGKPAAAKTHKVDSAKNATSGATTAATLNPWVVKPKHRQSAPQPAAVQNGNDKAKRISVNNRKKIKKLVAHWPALFSLDVARPLSVGIQAALIADAKARGLPITESQITYCLSTYAKRPAYLKALAAGGPRYDLNGQPCGEVLPEHQQEAERRLSAMQGSVANK